MRNGHKQIDVSVIKLKQYRDLVHNLRIVFRHERRQEKYLYELQNLVENFRLKINLIKALGIME